MLNDKKIVNFDYTPQVNDFMKDVMKTIVQQNDYRGIGGHGVEKHGPHGLHSQNSIGIGSNMTVNFREILK
jgi:hypothetical protein